MIKEWRDVARDILRWTTLTWRHIIGMWDIKDLTLVRGQDGKISDTQGKDFVGDQKSFPWVSEIFPSCPLIGVWFFFSLIFYWKYSIFLHETPHTWNMTWHIFWCHWRKGHLEIQKNENKAQIYLIRLDSVF